MSAVALATAGIAGGTAAADEPEGLEELRALMEAFGGGDVSDEALVQMLSMYEAMGVDPAVIFGMADPAMLAALAGADGEIDGSAFIEYVLEGAGDGTDDASAFYKVLIDGMDDGAFPKLTDELFQKYLASGVDDEALLEPDDAAFPRLDDLAFPKVEDSIANVQAALAQAAAQGDIDPATLEAILELLPEE